MSRVVKQHKDGNRNGALTTSGIISDGQLALAAKMVCCLWILLWFIAFLCLVLVIDFKDLGLS